MTKKLFLHDSYTSHFEAKVVTNRCLEDKYEIILDETYFYPESGGQPADHGYIGESAVLDVKQNGEEILQICACL